MKKIKKIFDATAGWAGKCTVIMDCAEKIGVTGIAKWVWNAFWQCVGR